MNDDGPTRRALLLQSSLGLLVPGPRNSESRGANPYARVIAPPDSIRVYGENGEFVLTPHGTTWEKDSVEVDIARATQGFRVNLSSPQEPMLRIHLRWSVASPPRLLFLGDDWERSYGDLAWRSMEPERIFPWYFLVTDRKWTAGFGVQTGAAAFCFWQVDPAGVSLWLDVRNGGSGVRLGGRKLNVASVYLHFENPGNPFIAAQHFCSRLCQTPRLPTAPVYGGNNWYYAYGHSFGGRNTGRFGAYRFRFAFGSEWALYGHR